MIDRDSYLTTPQIRDLLQHVIGQHYAHQGYLMESAPSPSNDCWEYFKQLDTQIRFQHVHVMLNELNFKTSLITMLNMIRSSAHQVTNGTFLCLESHLLNMFSASSRVQESSTLKFDSSKPTDTVKQIRFDENMLHNPALSEWLLHNVSLPSPAALKFGSSISPLTADVVLAVSSSFLCDVDTLRKEVQNILHDQCKVLVGNVVLCL